ncbi:GGDEF domain-containing protein [Sphingomonas sp. ID0503]|uniref:GGDEF domain-containing protein n=1 Tax=Sphingomonas sp. ID0503 TaxID=3399691 RepID=UPI003AFAAC32
MNHSLDILDRVRALMADGDIAPSPTNYEFWYRYVTGADPELVEAIDAVRRSAGKVSHQAMTNIRLELYGGADHGGMGKLLDDTQQQIARLTAHVDQSGQDARDYRGRLDTGNKALAEPNTAERQRAMLSEMIRATNAMIEKTSLLEKDLEQSGEKIQSLKADLEVARTESRTDPLTGLANRKAGSDYLAANVTRVRSEDRALSLVFMDIDYFKQFNDRYGHRLGDEVLRLVGSALEKFFHGIGFVARWGGEEFVVVMPGRSLAEAAAIADRFRAFVSARNVRSRDQQRDVGKITLSIGVAELGAEEGTLRLIDRADRALYRAKSEGRNRVVIDELEVKSDAA